MAPTTAQLVVVIIVAVTLVASIEPVVRTVVLDSVDLEASVFKEQIVTGFRAEDDVALRAGDVEGVLNEGIAVRLVHNRGFGIERRRRDQQHSGRTAIKVILLNDQARDSVPCQLRANEPCRRRTQK
jgi:hypothetical protein